MRKIDRFILPVNDLYHEFIVSFQEGARGAGDDMQYTECPHGLPDNPKWHQGHLLRLDEPGKAGWLLGWWAHDYICSGLYGHEYGDAVNHAGEMAYFLWVGAKFKHMDEIKNDQTTRKDYE
ncbi:hypothetical protein JYT79_01545 [Cardiobacterium sp. AH-315-I02]|nr:hypothetical protein [Cardiobacterium sp. AH-315-I02]